MSIRPDVRAQLHEFIRETLTHNHGSVPAAVRRNACQAYGISDRQMWREISRIRQGDREAPSPPSGWWDDERSRDHVLTAVAATDTMKQAWARLHSDGTVTASYEHFTRQLTRYLTPAVKAGLTGDGREDYLRASIYCTDNVPHRNTRWQADAQEVPVWVRGDNGEAPFKPYQVTFIDDATRIITGTVLIAGRPRSSDVLAALASAMRGQIAPDGTYIGGIPESIRWDNGREFLNDAVTLACARLGIAPRPASPYASWHKGKIERWHETSQNEMYSELPGASDGPLSFTGRQHWRPADDRLLTLSALTVRALDWVKSYNHDRVHSSLGTTPFQRWRADSQPLRVPTGAQLHPMMLTLPSPRTVNKDGISYKNFKFLAPELRDFKGRKVNVRVLPHDYDSIAVFDGDTFVCDAVRAEKLSPERRRQLVRARHEDYQQMKAAQDRAANRRAQEAVINGLTDPTPAQPAVPLAPGDLLPDDDALLDLLGDDA